MRCATSAGHRVALNSLHTVAVAVHRPGPELVDSDTSQRRLGDADGSGSSTPAQPELPGAGWPTK
eukprot:1048304-Rhodomonas_salina.1